MSLLSFFGLTPAHALEPGDPAPALTATDQDGKPLDFAAIYKSGVTLVYFYPKADTPGCTAEACSLRDNYTDLRARGLQVIGVSEDKAGAQKKFQDKYNLPFPLVADIDGAVAKAFGVPTTMGFAKRQSLPHQRRQNSVARPQRLHQKPSRRRPRRAGETGGEVTYNHLPAADSRKKACTPHHHCGKSPQSRIASRFTGSQFPGLVE